MYRWAGDENDSSVAAVQQQQKLKVAAQHAKSKEKKRREKYQATAAVRPSAARPALPGGETARLSPLGSAVADRFGPFFVQI